MSKLNHIIINNNINKQNIQNKNRTNNLSKSMHYELRRNKENKNKNKKQTIMDELLLSNPDLLNNFQKRLSKTPCRLRSKNKNNTFIYPNKYVNLISKNSKRNKKNKNIKKNNTNPLMKQINQRNKKKLNNKIKKNYSDTNNSTRLKRNKSQNVFYRNESFSIIDKNIINKENTNNNFLTPKNENSYDRINHPHIKVPKSSSKVNKKIFKIESLSQVGYSGPGIFKYNQDSFFIYKNLNDECNVLFIGVCDGHGLTGHDVSKYLINNLPKNLNTSLKKTNKYISHKETLYSTLKKVFIDTNKSLCSIRTIDTKFSGSTCVTIILTKNKIISANVGDSRAVMGRYIKGKWLSIDLTHDQKPNNPGEKERILSHGGRIEAYKDENGDDFGPKRVWLKDDDVPGLAMSRSFGDEIAASVGTISEPEIEEYEITEDDKFIIIASDGIWEFISSQECVEFIKDFYEKKDLKGCLKFLLNESSKRWIKEEEVIDDITAVLIFFNE